MVGAGRRLLHAPTGGLNVSIGVAGVAEGGALLGAASQRPGPDESGCLRRRGPQPPPEGPAVSWRES